MKVALLITSYNRPDALDLVLRSIANQSRIPDQIIICDDGSSVPTGNLVRSWASRLPLRYAWQPDRKFRAARVRNLGILAADADYLIWIDGDCILPSNFVRRHENLAKHGYLVAGGRHLLTQERTAFALAQNNAVNTMFRHWKFQYLPLGWIRDIQSSAWETVRTCNLSLYLDDFLKVAGFDESFEGWGREDSDFIIRLVRKKIRIRSGRLAACVAHLWHQETSRSALSVNDKLMQKTLQDENHSIAYSSMLGDL